MSAVGGKLIDSYPDGPSVVALPPWVNTTNALKLLNADPGMEYADADAPLHATGEIIPNDPGFSQQYGLDAIDAPQAWGITTGSGSTIIAVLDTGIDLNSPDIDPHLWRDPSNSKIHGWNFINNTSNIQDNNGHGTNVAGILGAIGNNGIGVAGVDWNSQIMPLKVLDSQGNGNTDAAVSAIYFAVQNGARVLNASWGGGAYSQAMIDAINYAGSMGAVFVTAAGNDSSNNDTTPTYPASYQLPNELVVAATDQYGNLASFSDYGATTVEVAAPGVNILSTVPGGYAEDTGTSMSTPFVSGTVALLTGAYPSLTADQLVAQIEATVTPDPALSGLVSSGGIVNAFNALTGHDTTNVGSGGTAVGGSFPSVEAAILNSQAFYNDVGGTPTGFVTGLYHALLNRSPDPQGLAYYVGMLQSGTTNAQLVNLFQNSTEAQLTRVARWYSQEVSTSETIAQYKANPNLAAWGTRFSSGETVAQAQQDILSANSYYASSGGTPTSYITSLYKGLLDRAPDAQGLNTFLGQLNSGTPRSQIVGEILSSTEGQLTTVAYIYQQELSDTTDSIATLKNQPGVAYWASLLGAD